ncbi:LacI family DNA-binding transcriptional regulator [Actinospica sp. MGRD01-02]|uniref:LacI family DNA-binding transcriptional regulator n=1 Tax=Actinospica acidithermotolerans TaxID=2828514 RepID=A0A941E7P2_9ACTN|nr:LacI family DNA-binding transcriptional regulator [Actinospica acidithermotolerans]MBR7826007.1 LacI family DNA-binding transcriptional regulator [Actinospica acidithermotolerans]
MSEDASSLNGRKPAPSLTIYDVARAAGVSIASVSRVLNGHTTPRPETRERVLRAVRELGFVPDGAARALSSRLKEVVAVVFRRPAVEPSTEIGAEPEFQDEADGLVFIDVVNRGIEISAQLENFDLLLSSVRVDEPTPHGKVAKLAGKSDGIILHDRVLTPAGVVRLSEKIPVVTLAGTPTRASVNIVADNDGGMRELTHHLLGTHGYRSIAYLSGRADSPDNQARGAALREVAKEYGIEPAVGPVWTGEYSAAGGVRVIRQVLAEGGALPRAICCANDQTALGVINEIQRHGLRVPEDVAVTGFDDVYIARHTNPPLTTVRQPIERLGALAFQTLHSMIGGERPAERQIVLPVHVVLRSSCGCRPDPAPSSGHGLAQR